MQTTGILEQKETIEMETEVVDETAVECLQGKEGSAEEMESRESQDMTEEITDMEEIPVAGFWQDDRGIGVIEIVLILVVLIALVLVFKNEITAIVSNAFTKISGDAGTIIK